jgi:hypothetical protein
MTDWLQWWDAAKRALPLALAIACALLLLGTAVLLLLSRELRRLAARFFFLLQNTLGLDIGRRGLVFLSLYCALPAVAAGFTKGWSEDQFHWRSFAVIFAVVLGVQLALNLLQLSTRLKRILGPIAGRVFREKRKTGTAGVLKEINLRLAAGSTSPAQLRKIVQDILDLVVLHVRDHRGSHKEAAFDVFANLLLVDEDILVVVARDSASHKPEYRRQIPARYAKSALLCGRAIAERRALSVGDLAHEVQGAPRNKPYRSILALPLTGSDDVTQIGAVSVDSSRPYFFQSFVQFEAEDELENSLQPYLQTLTLALERLGASDPRRLVQIFDQP